MSNSTVALSLANGNDLINFARHLIKCPEFFKLSWEEQMKIIQAYPVRVKVQ